MKKNIFAILLSVSFFTQTTYASVLGNTVMSKSHEIANGTIVYQNTFVSEQPGVGQQAEYVAEYIPNSEVIPNVVTGGDVWGLRTVTAAEKYMKNNGMVPLVGINASYFSFKTGVPMGHVISNGRIISKDTQEYRSIGFNEDGTAFIAPLAIKTILTSDKTAIDISHINKYNQSITDVVNLYTTDFGENNHTDSASLNLILGGIDGNLGIGDTLTATVEEKFNYTGSIKLPDNKIVLTLNESGNSMLYEALNLLEIGDKVSIFSEAVTDNERWSKVVSGLGSVGETLIENGKTGTNFASGAAPRTAVGITESGNIIFYVIDGRQKPYSYGVQLKTLAERMKELGCIEAINLDGGGSTVISGVYPGSDASTIINSPSEGTLRSCTNYIFLQNMQKPTGDISKLYLYPFAQHYLSGYSERIFPTAVDSAYYAVEPPSELNYSVSGTESHVDNGVLYAKGTGEFTVNVTGAEASGSEIYYTYETPTSIKTTVGGKEINSLKLKQDDVRDIDATANYYNIDLRGDDSCFEFDMNNDLGFIDEKGVLTVTAKRGSGVVTVKAGECIKEIPLTVIADMPFYDIDNHWASDMIADIYDRGIVNGYTDEKGASFKPDNSITREEFAVIMCRYLGIDTNEYAKYNLEFADSDKIASWSKNAVCAMLERGIMNGKGINFAPSDKLTRAEAMTILGRITGLTAEDDVLFTDGGDIPSWARMYISAMVSNGIVNGYGDGTIKPQGLVTRAEATTMLYKMMQ